LDDRAVEALLARAAGLHQSGRAAEAMPLYRQVLAARPDQPVALHLLGLALHQTGDARGGADLMARAVDLAPRYVPALINLGNAQQDLGQGEAAERQYRAALAHRPDAPEVWTNLGNALRLQKRLAEALDCHDRALALLPDFAVALSNRGTVLKEMDRPAEAAAAFQRALALGFDGVDALTGLGDVKRILGDRAGAEALHRRALAGHPGSALAWNNLGRVQEDTARLAQARASYDRALALDPGSANARFNRGRLALMQGDLATGWPGYEARLDGVQDHRPRQVALPPWQGESLAGRRLLVWREQGVGDEVMFGALYPALLARCRAEGGQLVLEADPRLLGLLRRSLPGALVRAETDDPRDADVGLPAGSLPRQLQPRLGDVTPAPGWLRPDPAQVAFWAGRLAALGPGLKVGLCWRSRRLTTERARAYTRLSDWTPLFALPGIIPVSLQYGEAEGEITALEAASGHRLHRWSDLDLTDDLDGVAACMAGLDLVISAPTAAGELAAAVGTPAWRLASADWTWLGTGVRPWFPTMRCFSMDQGAAAAVASVVRSLARLGPAQG